MHEPAEPAARVPLRHIFRVFVVIGATGFGGGASAHIHRAVVERERWLDEERFLEGMTVARVLPGTNVSNLAAFVGSVLGGYRGALVAVLGVVTPGALTILALAIAYSRLGVPTELLARVLHGLGAGAAGLMAALVFQAAKTSARSARAMACAAAAFAGVAVMGWSVLLVLAVLTPLASWLLPGEEAR